MLMITLLAMPRFFVDDDYFQPDAITPPLRCCADDATITMPAICRFQRRPLAIRHLIRHAATLLRHADAAYADAAIRHELLLLRDDATPLLRRRFLMFLMPLLMCAIFRLMPLSLSRHYCHCFLSPAIIYFDHYAIFAFFLFCFADILCQRHGFSVATHRCVAHNERPRRVVY